MTFQFQDITERMAEEQAMRGRQQPAAGGAGGRPAGRLALGCARRPLHPGRAARPRSSAWQRKPRSAGQALRERLYGPDRDRVRGEFLHAFSAQRGPEHRVPDRAARPASCAGSRWSGAPTTPIRPPARRARHDRRGAGHQHPQERRGYACARARKCCARWPTRSRSWPGWPGRRRHLLVQPALVRVHRHHARADGRAGAGSRCTTRTMLPQVLQRWQRSIAHRRAVRDGSSRCAARTASSAGS